ncbi:TetR/AcrR family transcriptional regulator [Pseudoruegeria aquimaris]|uniref:TetR/AcrR family transcriptional regulator n=1 Tax=Pseudoruegeria aquimaris TaxID=393663 RepID=UPI0015945F29|nr:TetR/AcrR family transcriptional regulator [Pseudoruegeria aquimaris]
MSKSERTRAAILDAAREFLRLRPFRELTVAELMKSAGASRATFYQYFNDLHGLMATLLDEVKEGIVTGAQPWFSEVGDPAQGLRHSLAALVAVGAEKGFILRAVSDAATQDARLEDVWEGFIGAFDELVAERIARDQALGLIAPFEPSAVARALNRMDAATLIQAFGRPPMADRGAVLAALERIWLSTLYPDTPLSGNVQGR